MIDVPQKSGLALVIGIGGRMPRPTVNDIAREAGVSLATVDRVLNERAGVRDKTVARVRAAIDRIGYVRDVSAANLARGRLYSFVFLLPEGAGQFVSALGDAVRQAGRAGGLADRAEIRTVTYPAHDPHAFVRVLNTLNKRDLDGVAILAPETPHVRDAVRHLRRRGVPVVAFVSDLPNAEVDHFIGINNVAAGQTAGSLMGRFLPDRPGSVMVLASSLRARDSVERRLGFDMVMAQSYPHLRILPTIEGHDDADIIRQAVDSMRAHQGPVAGVYSMASGNTALIDALEGCGSTVIVHELTSLHRRALEDGRIDAVITQNVGHLVRSAIRVMRAKIDGASIDAAQERIRIEIVLRENLS